MAPLDTVSYLLNMATSRAWKSTCTMYHFRSVSMKCTRCVHKGRDYDENMWKGVIDKTVRQTQFSGSTMFGALVILVHWQDATVPAWSSVAVKCKLRIALVG